MRARPRSMLGSLDADRRRDDGLPWSSSLGLLVAALLVNYAGLYGTASALAEALEPRPFDRDDQVIEFDLLGDSSFDMPERLADHEGQGLEPSPESDHDRAPEPASKARHRDPARGEQGRSERGDQSGALEGVGEGQSLAPGDDSLVDAEDGEVESEGAAPGAAAGTLDPLARIGGSPSMLDETFGPIRASDVMRDVDEGVENVLESKRHVFGSFFNRFADGVREHWRPAKVHDAADPTQTKYGTSPRTTVLMLRLDEKGEVLKVVILEKSGAPHLDAEAVRAVKAAGPFPNPPEGLADDRGYIEFPVGFTLVFGGAPRIFRF